jgi:formate-nitrite transporter family protein
MSEKVTPHSHAPLTPAGSILEAEVDQAVGELKRPMHGIVMSGLIAGFGVGVTVLAIALVMTLGADVLSDPVLRLLIGNAYAIGFIIVIMANTDLFTEYTTIALLPVLTGRAPIREVVRLWGLIYVANLVGGFLFAWLLVSIGPSLEIARTEVFSEIGMRVAGRAWWVILLSALLAGWLMGLLSWLIASSKQTIAQIVFCWLIAMTIGLGDLPHAVVGAIEMFAALLIDGPLGPGLAVYFLVWTLAGNIIGSGIFACVIRYSVLIRGDGSTG